MGGVRLRVFSLAKGKTMLRNDKPSACYNNPVGAYGHKQTLPNITKLSIPYKHRSGGSAEQLAWSVMTKRAKLLKQRGKEGGVSI